MKRRNPALPYQDGDHTHFKRLGIPDGPKPQDIAVFKDGRRWQILRLLKKRDGDGNLKYACQSEDGNDGNSFAITHFIEVLRPDITFEDGGSSHDGDGSGPAHVW